MAEAVAFYIFGAGPIRPTQTKTPHRDSMSHMGKITTTRTMGIQQALEWAFAREKAQIDFDATGAHEFDRVGIDPLWRAMQLKVLGTAVDGGGSSDPHPDAVIIAGAVESTLPRAMALTVVEMARGGMVPDWKGDPTRRIAPYHWHMRDDGVWTAATRQMPDETYIDRKRRMKKFKPEVCPIVYTGGAPAIGRARRAYLEWYGALIDLACVLRRPRALLSINISDQMPPVTPWMG